MEYKEILRNTKDKTGMTQKQFAEYFGIPLITIQQWMTGKRKAPEYVVNLMMYKLENEKKIDII